MNASAAIAVLAVFAACAAQPRLVPGGAAVAEPAEPSATDLATVGCGAVAPLACDEAGAQPPAGEAGAERDAAAGLAAVEARLGRGELGLAVADLLELSRRFPADARVRARLVRVLHQRALLLYGQGAVERAMRDWERVVALEPTHADAARMLAAARTELAGAAPK